MISTAQQLFLQYYATCRNVTTGDILAVLSISTKSLESTRKTRDIINVIHYLNSKRGKEYKPMEYAGDEFYELKKDLVESEYQVLTRIGFGLRKCELWGYLVGFARVLECSVEECWKVGNDVLGTFGGVFFDWRDLAGGIVKFVNERELPRGWEEVLGVDSESVCIVEKICWRMYR